MSTPEHGMGNIPDRFDGRDVPLFSAEQVKSLAPARVASATATTASIKPVILPDLPPVYDQGSIGSCTANAACAALRYAIKKYNAEVNKKSIDYQNWQPSRLCAYYYGRLLARQPPPGSEKEAKERAEEERKDPWDPQKAIKTDSGCNNRTVIYSFLMKGVCREDLWPYGNPTLVQNTNSFDTSTRPNPCEPKDIAAVETQARGASHSFMVGGKDLNEGQYTIPRAVSFYRIYDTSAAPSSGVNNQPPTGWETPMNSPPIQLLQKTIDAGFPIVFGVKLAKGANLYGKPDSNQFTADKIFVRPPTENFESAGGHAMLVVGYDSSRSLFLVQNSWGTGWPELCTNSDGRFWMPYEWFTAVCDVKYSNGTWNYPVTHDFWVIKFGVSK